MNSMKGEKKNMKSMDSVEDLKSMESGDGYYYDQTYGIVFVKLKGTYSRDSGEVEPCGRDNEACITKIIVFKTVGQDKTADCTQREGALDHYQEPPLDGTGGIA